MPGQYPACSLFRNHQGRTIRIAAGNSGHDTGIHHTQTGDAVHTQMGVNYSAGVVGPAHAGCAGRVKNGGGDIAGQACQFLV